MPLSVELHFHQMSRGLFTRLQPLCPVLELFIRPSTAGHRRGLQGYHSTALFHLSCCCPQHQTPPPRDQPTRLASLGPPKRMACPEKTWPLQCNRYTWRPPRGLLPSTAPHPTEPPTTPLTGWGGRAVAANWKLVLEGGQSAWWGESTQHRGEEEGVGGHRVPIEVPSPRCWAGAAVAGHAKQPQSEGQADSLAGGSGGLQAAPPRGMGPGPRGGLGGQPTPSSVLELLSKASRLISASCSPHSSWGPGGLRDLRDVPRAGPLVKQFCELVLSWEGSEQAFRTSKRMPLLDGPRLGSWREHIL